MTGTQTHWDQIYQNKDHTQVSWHQAHSTLSIDWILECTTSDEKIIDVGCGVSILADNLLDKDYTDITLLELSANALKSVKQRLKEQQNKLTFHHGNILNFKTKQSFKLWHDRAVFHFLTQQTEQQIYLRKLNAYLQIGGYFLLATFSPKGPKNCSALNIEQYDLKKISHLLGNNFQFIKDATEQHPHPNGSTQHFNYFLFVKRY